MKTKTLLLLFLLIGGMTAAQTGLRYKWKAGSTQKFQTTQTDVIKMGGGMMGMVAMEGNMVFKTESLFSLRIDKVMPNGSATGSFFLNQFKVTDQKGNVLASLKDLPQKAVEADFTVDAKGNFTFTEIPILIQREGGNLLVTHKIEKGEMAVSAEADGEKVTLFAEFNPKTGSLKAGYNVATIAKPKPKQVVVSKEDETIDLLPTEFLDLLALPEGPVAAGQSFKTKMYTTEITETVEDFTANIARIRFDIASSLDAQKFEKDAKKMAGDEEEGHDDDMGMENDLPPGMGGGNGTPQMSQEVTGTMNLRFDNGLGMMKELSGNITSKMNMMGMETESKSTLKMVALP